ncbi:MAG: ABC transporter permease [Bacilli bacterium]|nr:ABC transporter permease [Bacilli bacterium]
MNVLGRLYEYRELLKSNIKKEIRGKYKGSFLGILWSFISPLLMVLVYAIVFPYILRVKQENYFIFIIVAIIPWTFFTNVITQGTTAILSNANIIKKVYFPREILPISVATSGLINFFISCIIIFIFVIFSGIGLSKYVLLLPVIALIQYFLSLGLIFITSSINIYMRDMEYIIAFIMQILFYATPIIYSIDMFPEKYRWILNINPLAAIMASYRDILFYKQMPNLTSLGVVTLISFLVLIIGYVIFRNLEKGFAEEV